MIVNRSISPPSRAASGFALVVVLVVTTVVAIGLVAYLTQAMAVRAESQAAGNSRRAHDAAQSAVDLGVAQLSALLLRYPESATAWVPSPTPATVLSFRAEAGSESLTLQPLYSGATPSKGNGIAAYTLAHPGLPFEHEDNSLDLNRARFPGDAQGWIGSPVAGRLPIRVPWVEFTNKPLPEPTPGAEGEEVEEPPKQILRACWWIEDESFRLNVNQLGAEPRGEGAGISPSEIPLQGGLAAVITDPEARDEMAAALLRLRGIYPGGFLPEIRALNHLGSGALGDRLRFYLTPHSGALNVTRLGSQRVNLNEIVTSTLDPGAVREELDALLAPIRRALPEFGQRFYATEGTGGRVPDDHAEIYLQKLVANLRDYLSPTSQPTVVMAGGSVQIGATPEKGIEAIASVPPRMSNNPVIAMGKENVPYLQEYACRVTLKRFQAVTAQYAGYEFYLDHYFEFWNMGTSDISIERGDLGEEPFLKVYDLPGFDTGAGTPIPEGGEFTIPLPKNLVFPAGKVTVLTTDPTPNSMLVPSLERVVVLPLPNDHRYFTGRTTLKTIDGKFRVNLKARSTKMTDYQTKVLLGNERGMIESANALPLVRGDSPGNEAFSIHNDELGNIVWDRAGGRMREAYFVRGGSLHGNREWPAITGDPRTNNEQLFFREHDESGDLEQTRYYHSGLGNPSSDKKTLNVPAESTVGKQNWNFVFPQLWPDPFPVSESGTDSPMYIANGPMKSIGELGHLFDPARDFGPTGNIAYSRGGGRTLNIGQPDSLAQGELAAWRLTDLFSTSSELSLPGRVNLNGIGRDGGIAVRALFNGFTFRTGADADPVLSGKRLKEAAVEALIASLQAQLATGQPLMERGELSEHLGRMPNEVPRGDLHDRGREEVFRRMVELITTRGNVFTLYTVGQCCLRGKDDTRIVQATARQQVTFELIPEWAGTEESQPAEHPPKSFSIRVLSVMNR